ncbi:MAG TPA: hypothetical protein VK837_14425 [Longimicrobiales bacterium]|nr:hypothetical protein [Longimicrobiales bacterium]
MRTTAPPPLLGFSRPFFIASLAGLALVAVPAAPLAAQGSDAPVRLKSAYPDALMVNPAEGTTRVRLTGENVNAGDVRWNWRLYRYYVRRAGEAGWRRLYLNPQGSWYETEKDLAPLRANGWSGGWGPGMMDFELPNDVYLRAPGALEFRVERGEWHEHVRGSGDDAVYTATFDVEDRSNVLKVAIAAAPTAAPTVTGIHPAHVPVLAQGAEPAVIRVSTENLMPGADARVGVEPCDIILLHAAEGYLECRVPASLQSKPGLYLVGVTTARGGPRRLGRLHVQAPLQLGRPSPLWLPVADSVARVRFSYRGGTPLRARLRGAEGWQSARVASSGADAVTLEVPATLARQPRTLEVELGNAAGTVQSSIPVCGGDGAQPDACPALIARVPAIRRPGAAVAAPPPSAQRRAIVINPTDPVSLRPQPEPPGLTGLDLAPGRLLRLADGRAVAWRRIDGAARLVLIDAEGRTAHVFDRGVTLGRDQGGAVYVRVQGGVLAVGRAAARQR